MAFNFFKKTETADLILHNGHIFTQDPQMPWTSAVACKDEKILGVGDFEGMQHLIGPDTQVIDLGEKYMFPGFIDVHRSPVLKVFDGRYLDLINCHTTEDVLEAVQWFAEDNPDDEIIFGYGYDDPLRPSDAPSDNADPAGVESRNDGDEEADSENPRSHSAEILSRACNDRPVILLAKSCVDCWTNLTADQIITDTAEEEVVQTITTAYALNLLIPFDFDDVELSVKQEIEALSDKGFTSVLNLGSPDYFENLYQDAIMGLYNEGEMRQRFFGSYYANRPLLPAVFLHKLSTRRTNCIEMGEMVHADMLNLYLENATSPAPFSQDALNLILEQISDKNFGIFLEAVNEEDLLMAYEALEHVRSKGYKNTFVIASDYELPNDKAGELYHAEDCIKTWGSNLMAQTSLSGHAQSTAEAIDQLTIQAAAVLGKSGELGMITKGRLADFVVFDEDPFSFDLKTFFKLHASMTILGGQVVYDADAEADMELYNLMSSQHL